MNEPRPRTIATSQDAEVAARDWLRWMGFHDAEVGPRGPDGGLDVNSSRLVAQVKTHVRPTGRPVIQQTHGAAVASEKRSAVFSLGGFTDEAVGFADEVDMALFTFDYSGRPQPENPMARVLFSQAGGAQRELLEEYLKLPAGKRKLVGLLNPRLSRRLGRHPIKDGPIAWIIEEDDECIMARVARYRVGARDHLLGVKAARRARPGVALQGEILGMEAGRFGFSKRMLLGYYSVPVFLADGVGHQVMRLGGVGLNVKVVGYKTGSHRTGTYPERVGGVRVDVTDLLSGHRRGTAFGIVPVGLLGRRRTKDEMEERFPVGSKQLVSCNSANGSGHYKPAYLEGFQFGIDPAPMTTLLAANPEEAFDVLATVLSHEKLGLGNFDVFLPEEVDSGRPFRPGLS